MLVIYSTITSESSCCSCEVQQGRDRGHLSPLCASAVAAHHVKKKKEKEGDSPIHGKALVQCAPSTSNTKLMSPMAATVDWQDSRIKPRDTSAASRLDSADEQSLKLAKLRAKSLSYSQES